MPLKPESQAVQNPWQAIVCMLATCVFPGAADAAEPSARPSVEGRDSPANGTSASVARLMSGS